MLFIDSNDLLSQYRLTKKLSNLRSQKEYYEDKKVEVIKNWDELNTNNELLEKFARENYLMKKPTEDIYVVVESDWQKVEKFKSSYEDFFVLQHMKRCLVLLLLQKQSCN